MSLLSLKVVVGGHDAWSCGSHLTLGRPKSEGFSAEGRKIKRCEAFGILGEISALLNEATVEAYSSGTITRGSNSHE